MREADWQIVDELRAACQAHEKRTTFYPFSQGCGQCRGFPFGETDCDANLMRLRKELGCCGCVVAMEMELLAADIRPPANEPAIAPKQTMKQDALAELVDKRGGASRQSLFYLNQARSKHERTPHHGRRAMTRQMRTRHRLHKDAGAPKRK